MDILPNFEVVVGTYEEYLLGYKFSSTDKSIIFNQSFATHSHTSSIRCVTSSGRFLACGSADDRIIIYDMLLRKEHCSLSHHNATVNCIAFTLNHSHLISGSDDGIMSIVRVGNWQLEKQWGKPHKGASIRSISVHPSGKLALTLGSDHTLRTWNLVKGREAYAVNLMTKSTDAKSLEFVHWNLDGTKFLLGGGNYLELWSMKSGGILHTFQFKSRCTCACWLNKNLVASGHEDGTITLINIDKKEQNVHKAHTLRLKSLQSNENWLVTASSDGYIKLWKFSEKSIRELSKCSTGCRCTSLTLVTFQPNKKEEKQSTSEEEVVKELNEDDDVKPPIKEQTGKVIIEIEDEVGKKRKSKSKNRKNNKKLKQTDDQGWTVEDL